MLATATCQSNLAEELFGDVGIWTTIEPSSGIAITCKSCEMTVARIVEDCLIVTGRHNGSWHVSVISLLDMGYVKNGKTTRDG